jgi:hypothetical protein
MTQDRIKRGDKGGKVVMRGFVKAIYDKVKKKKKKQ